MGRTTQPCWADPHDDALKRHRAAGFSSAQIAGLINTEFGTGYSRNAVIGRATRMGLPQNNRPGTSKAKRVRPPREHKARLIIIRANGNSSGQRIIESAESVEMFKLRCVEIVPRNVSLIELKPSDCRYPYGEGSEITFCGHGPLYEQIVSIDAAGMSIKRISAYCKAHHFLCVGPGTYSEQRANVVAKELVA